MNQELAIGIDLGGTNVRIALMNAAGEIIDMQQQPTQGDRAITEMKRQFIKNDKYKNPFYWAPFVYYGN